MDYPGDIEAALVDAVFSTRYAYTTPHGRGLTPLMRAWLRQRNRGQRGPSATALISEIVAAGGAANWTALHFTRHRASGRLKAEVVLEAAEVLVWQGFDRASAVTASNLFSFLDFLQGVRGIGLPTARYVAMLLGFQEVKPDVMIKAFIRSSVDRWVTDCQALAIVKAAGRELGVADIRSLDHAIWNFQRDRTRD